MTIIQTAGHGRPSGPQFLTRTVMCAIALASSGPSAGAPQAFATNQSHMLKVTATYWLSEDGRKAALLAGLDGRARQTLAVDVPAARLHLVSVDAQGVPRLKLRPRYDRRSEDQIVRIDVAPTFDAPPSLDDLFALAASNYELERTFHAERVNAKTHRVEAELELRSRVAQVFLADPSQRALPHPAPTPTRCFVQTDRGRRLFDVGMDQGLARELPPEAHRRFRSDLKARRERNQEVVKAQRALHEQKKAAVAVWIGLHGTPDQQTRQAAGVLPLAEAIEAMTDHAFAAVNGCESYVHDGAMRLQTYLRAHPGYEEAVVSPADLIATNTQPTTATQSQWALLQQLRSALPAATVYLRAHRLTWQREPRAPRLTVYSAVAVQRVDLFTLRREYAAPD